MKEYLLLYKSLTESDKYYPMKNNMQSGLWNLNEYFLNDYKYYNVNNQNFFDEEQIYGQETIIINDKQSQNIYILMQNHDIEDHISYEQRAVFTNETNSCKISHDNFKEFIEKWVQLKKDLPEFALIYRDNFDWIDCKGFQTKEAMEAFVKDFKDEIVH